MVHTLKNTQVLDGALDHLNCLRYMLPVEVYYPYVVISA